MDSDLSSLFRPGRIGDLELTNRIIKSPQNTSLANENGTVSTRLVNHYRRLAEGGAGLLIVEYSYIDDDASRAVQGQVGISRLDHVAGLGWLVDEVHAAGARIGIQLAHCGRQRFLGTAPIKSASDVSWPQAEAPHGVRPQPMTPDDIRNVIEAFGRAAHRAWCARFDLVEVHAGHGYLLTNFLSPHTNKRFDEYGGSFENRSRLLLEVVKEIRGRVPRELALSVRLSVTDYEPDGIPIEETVELSCLLEAAGVDLIHASGGHHARMEYEVSSWFMPRAVHREGWTRIKEAVSIPVAASGSLVEPGIAAEALQSGSADFVSVGRPMLADPDWPIKARAGRVADIVPCIRCNDGCLHRASRVGRSTGCAVNPNVGAEYRYPITPPATAKRIAVAGGGPAGLHAAAMLADRGHDVTLFEPGALGGRLVAATRSPLKRDLSKLLDHLVHQVSRRDIAIRVQPATAGELRAHGYESVLVATGARPWEPFARGPVATVHAADIADPAGIAGPVVIVGAGLTGCDTALWLAGCGVGRVTLVEAEEIMWHDEVFTDRAGLPAVLARAGVDIRQGTRVVGLVPDGVRVRDRQGGEAIIQGGTVVLACGYRPDRTLADELRNDADIEVAVIGTARRGARVMDAMHDAFFTARRI